MNAQEYLSRALRLEKRIKADMRRIEYWTEKSYGVSGMQYDAMPHNPNCPSDAPFVRCLEKASALEADVERKKRQLVLLRKEISMRISLLTNPEERFVLRRHYLDGDSWEKISEMMVIPERKVLHIHGDALKHFPVPDSPECYSEGELNVDYI